VKRAASLAEHILHDYADELPGGVTLLPSSGGVFEVSLGRKRIFSKKRAGRFPEEGEVEQVLERAFGGDGDDPGPLAGGALDAEGAVSA
jgi:selenoprotein W-related protein